MTPALTRELMCRVDTDKDGLDDLAISGDLVKMVRLERMDSGIFWGMIYMKDGRELTLSFYVGKGRKLEASAEW